MAAAAATISDGLEIVLYWSPEMISCSAAIVASLPVTGGTGIHARRLEGGDGAAAGAVVGGHDALDVGAEAGDLAGRPFLCLRRRPVGRVELGQRLVAGIFQPLVDAVADQAGGRVGRRTVDLQHARAFGHAGALHVLHQRFRDRLADALIVEGDVVVGRLVGDRAVVGDDLDALRLRQLNEAGGRGGIDRVEHDHLGALRDHRVELLLLQRHVGVGVLVDDRAVGAELLHLGLEARKVVLLVAGRGLVGHQEGHRGVFLRPRGATHERQRKCADESFA